MKTLIFTHGSDIDGMGGAVLAKLAFKNVDYVLSEAYNLHEHILNYINSNKIYEYNQIFVTDLSLEEPTLTQVATDQKLNGKFFLFDHHESAKEAKLDKYPFTTIKIESQTGLCSGTSLFYEYLLEKGFFKNNKAIKEFSELTRKYDTWEWQTKYENEKPRELSLLFDILGPDGYIALMTKKLSTRELSNFEFDDVEKMLISNKKHQVESKLKSYYEKAHYKTILNKQAAIVFIDYEYRNDIAEYFRKNNVNVDFVMLIALDHQTISYRTIKNNTNVRIIAESFGGKGHDYAAGSQLSSETLNKIIDIITK